MLRSNKCYEARVISDYTQFSFLDSTAVLAVYDVATKLGPSS